jgi:hypothetical protein
MPLPFSNYAWYIVLFSFGTEDLYVIMQGNVWYIAHVVATTFLLLYIIEALGKQRAWLAGFLLGLAALSRTTTLFTFPFFLLLTFTCKREERLRMWRRWIFFSGMLGLFVIGMLLYNLVRFGSLFDFGYTSMNVDPLVHHDLLTYGQFNLHFIPTNLRYLLLEPPRVIKTFPYITFNPIGTGILWTTPAFVCVGFAFRLRHSRQLALSLLVACLLPMCALLMYFNTGWYQFGYRFIMDVLPFLLLLTILGMRKKLGWPEMLLIGASVLINVWGYFVFAYFWPPLVL